MNLIETYNGSGLYAQYATSADYASNGQALSAALTAVPAGTMNEINFSYDASNNITAYNGSAFKAGDELPASVSAATDYVTATSGDINSTIDNVSSNSAAWGGSALPISAGPGIKVNLVDNTLVFSNDETVLFSGDLTASTTAQLTESWKNFEEIRCYGYSGPGGAMFGCGRTNDLLSAYSDDNWCPDIGLNTVASWVHRDNFSINANMPLVFSADNSVASLNGRLLGYWNGEWQLSTNEQRCHCTLILGINRISANV